MATGYLALSDTGLPFHEYRVPESSNFGLPSSEEFDRALHGFERDERYFATNRDELWAAYAGRWVAIYDARVVGDAADLPSLLQSIEGRQIPQGLAVVKHLIRQDTVRIS